MLDTVSDLSSLLHRLDVIFHHLDLVLNNDWCEANRTDLDKLKILNARTHGNGIAVRALDGVYKLDPKSTEKNTSE